jgi:hypothetical protein
VQAVPGFGQQTLPTSQETSFGSAKPEDLFQKLERQNLTPLTIKAAAAPGREAQLVEAFIRHKRHPSRPAAAKGPAAGRAPAIYSVARLS